jgi:hypothetical protein
MAVHADRVCRLSVGIALFRGSHCVCQASAQPGQVIRQHERFAQGGVFLHLSVNREAVFRPGRRGPRTGGICSLHGMTRARAINDEDLADDRSSP